MAKQLDEATIRRSVRSHYKIRMEIKWQFNPAHAPHFGGLWEAGVKSTKHHLKRVLGNTKLNFEEFTTVLTQIESCLNSRPLYPLTEDAEDLEVLTPGHFFIGRALNTIPEPTKLNVELNRLSRFELLTRLTTEFWIKWSREYLNHLQHRRKWTDKQQNLKIGQIVIIKDDHIPQNQWMLGRIQEIQTGKDELVRSVTLRTRGANISRPIHKLCPLPMDEVEPEPQGGEDVDA